MNFVFALLYATLFYIVHPEILNKEIIEAFEKDKLTYTTYRQSLKELSCKLLTYSKLRDLFESKRIDIYFIHPGIKNDKRGFYNYVKNEMLYQCRQKITEVDVLYLNDIHR